MFIPLRAEAWRKATGGNFNAEDLCKVELSGNSSSQLGSSNPITFWYEASIAKLKAAADEAWP
jgi:hypothetical protein